MTHAFRPLAVASLVISMPFAAVAQQEPPAPDLRPMAQSLDVSVALIEACLPRPQTGERPERPDVDAIRRCLQTENASLTSKQVEAALEAHRPPPRGNN